MNIVNINILCSVLIILIMILLIKCFFNNPNEYLIESFDTCDIDCVKKISNDQFDKMFNHEKLIQLNLDNNDITCVEKSSDDDNTYNKVNCNWDKSDV
jgi:hypothetical protein